MSNTKNLITIKVFKIPSGGVTAALARKAREEGRPKPSSFGGMADKQMATALTIMLFLQGTIDFNFSDQTLFYSLFQIR